MSRSKCAKPYCRRACGKKSRWCPRCAYRRLAELHPVTCAFNNLRKRARQRGKTFTITREEFERLVVSSGWIEKRGKTAKSLSIDRIDNSRGYEPGNLRVVTLATNSRLKYAPLPEWMKAEMKLAERPENFSERSESGVDEPF